MGVFSGMLGIVNGHSTVRDWTISQAHAAQNYVASNTKGGTGRQKGFRSWNGSFNAYGAIPTLFPGDSFTFTGMTAPDSGVEGSTGEQLSGTARIDQLVVNWNWEAGEIINYSYNFTGHLALTESNAVVAADTTQPAVPPVCLAKIEHSPDDTNFYEIPDVASAVLTITAANQTYVNSGTIVSSELWQGVVAGPIDWTLAITQHSNDPQGGNGQPSIGTRHQLRVYDDATSYWLLKWGHCIDYSNLTVNRETGDIISRTINFGMDGFDGTGTGEITLPGAGSAAWPS